LREPLAFALWQNDIVTQIIFWSIFMASYRNLAANLIGVMAVMACLGVAPVKAADGKNVAKPNAKAIEKIVREYLLKNPGIINEALEAHQRNVTEAEQQAVRHTIQERQNDLRNDPNSVVGGNVAGDVTVVEFFDYRCGVCKRLHPIVGRVVKLDGKVRRVYKEWPILGPQSILAARAAIASRKQGDAKYLKFHNSLMVARQALSSSVIMTIAANAGLDTKKLTRDMKAPEIDKILRANYDLARALKLTGTPSFLIGDTLLRGGRDAETMLNIVRDERRKG